MAGVAILLDVHSIHSHLQGTCWCGRQSVPYESAGLTDRWRRAREVRAAGRTA